MGLLNNNGDQQQRAVVVGLDGVPFTLLQQLRKAGRIPHMNSLFEKGYFDCMSVCIPEISSVSWSSFMTGTQAAEHGIFGFIDLKPQTYSMYFPNYHQLRAPTIWDNLGEVGKKSLVINVPATYPAKEINGILISGFVAIDINKAVYPKRIIPQLNSMGYRIDLDTLKSRQDSEFLFEDLDATLKGRQKAVDYLWDEIDWDLLIVVITGTDRLMHFLWNAYEDVKHKHHTDFLDYFTKVDSFIGHVFERFESLDSSRNSFYMLSDHGFTKIKTEVYLNRWLQENGYLKFATQAPKSIMDIGPGSTAFVMDPSRVYINMQGKYPKGTVAANDYDRIRHEIKSGLESLTFNGAQPVAQKIYFKEELYRGPLMEKAPDLVILSHHGYDLKGRVGTSDIFGTSGLQGMHTQDDAFFFSSSGVPCTTIFDAKKVIETS